MQREQSPQLADPTENPSIIGSAIITARSFGTAPEALVALNALQADLAHESQQRITDIRHDAELGGYYYLLHDGYYEHAEKESDLALLGTFTSSIEAAPDVETGISSFMAQLDHGSEESEVEAVAAASSVKIKSTQEVTSTQSPSIGARIVGRANNWREKFMAVPTRTREIGALALAAVSLVVAVSASNINEGTTARMQTPVAESTENMGPKQPLIFEEKTAETTVVPAAETSKISLSDLVASLATTTTVAPKAAAAVPRTQEAKPAAAERTISRANLNLANIPNINGVDKELIKDVVAYMVNQQGLTVKGASYLTGNFITESGIDPNSEGGYLAQWAGSRLVGVPKGLYEQIDFALNVEMDRDGMASDLDELLRDPKATTAQIRDGLKRWERWGIQGQRFEFAETILSAIQNS